MKAILVRPNVGNFVNSLRDMGYSFDIAVADIIDNSISADACIIKISAVNSPELNIGIFDNGCGMSEDELVEAMRLATKNPDLERSKNDLGRFGLGLKTASFSQCRSLTVISKKEEHLSIKKWDLDYITDHNEWLLLTPELDDFFDHPLFEDLNSSASGTLVIWNKIDRYRECDFSESLVGLKKHLSLVFHRFLEGIGLKRLKIYINDNKIEPFNPFNPNHAATQQIAEDIIKYNDAEIKIQPFILPHHSKLSQQEYDRYSTEDGYTASQGFYLYRQNRLLIYGTWWGLHKTIDAHKLVRIKVDIPNSLDSSWGIDIKKATARPERALSKDLRRIIGQVTEKGSRPYTGRGKKIEDASINRFWGLKAVCESIRFTINMEHPLLDTINESIDQEVAKILNIYLRGLEAYLPLDAIQAHLNNNPYKINQENDIEDDELKRLMKIIKATTVDPMYIEQLLNSELFKSRKVD